MFFFEKAHVGSSYALYEAKVGGKVVGVVLKTYDKNKEVWFETRVLTAGYEEKEVWDAFEKSGISVS